MKGVRRDMGRSFIRLLWLLAGFVSLGFGIIGIALPGLPTVPFLLLTAFCFERGSERFHNWLVHHERLGPPIRDWRQHGAISRRAKVLALITMVSLVCLSYLMGLRIEIILAQIGVMSLVSIFILSRPIPPRDEEGV